MPHRLSARRSMLVQKDLHCLFYKAEFTVREIQLPKYNAAEVMVVYVQGSGLKLIIVIIYQPGSVPVGVLTIPGRIR